MTAKNEDQLLTTVQDLQMRMEFQEDSISQLNDVIAKQDRIIAELEEQVKYLADKFRTVSASLEDGQVAPANEKPPHY